MIFAGTNIQPNTNGARKNPEPRWHLEVRRAKKKRKIVWEQNREMMNGLVFTQPKRY